MTSLLVKVGDVWIDPLAVTAIVAGNSYEYPGCVADDGRVTLGVQGKELEEPECYVFVDGCQHHVAGVSMDDAARIVQRARESQVVKW